MNNPLAETIGKAARARRKELDLTQEDMAEQVGITPEFYGRIERGKTLPSIETLIGLANALGTNADYLLGGRTKGAAPVQKATATMPSKSTAFRKLLRRLDRASPRTIRLLNLLAAELERK